MMISKQELIDMKACEEGLERFILQTNNTEESVDVDTLISGHNTVSDLLWLAGETLPKSKIVRFACDCALINIELIKPYTNKYDEIVEFLKNPSADTAAYAAAYAAANAAAAYAAAYAAANAAANAAAANADAAAANADAAAANAAANADRVNKLLLELFK